MRVRERIGEMIGVAHRDLVHGDRGGTFVDPFDNQWTVATRIEDISVEEMHRRADAAQSVGAD